MRTALLGVLVMILAVCAGAAQADTLVAHWTFDAADISGTSALDTSGNNNTAARQVGAVTFADAGVFGNAATLNGSSNLRVANSASINSSTGMTQPRTVSLWFYTPDTTSARQYMVYMADGSSYVNIDVETYTQKIRWIIGSLQVETAANGYINAWHNVVSTFDGDTTEPTYHKGRTRLYVDGTYINSRVVNPQTPGTNPLYIGGLGNTGPTYPFTGKLDDIGIWNRQFNDAEARSLWTFGRPDDSYAYGYDLGAVNQLLDVHLAGSGSVMVGNKIWSYATGLTAIKGSAVAGDLFTSSGHDYLYLSSAGTGTGLMESDAAGSLKIYKFYDSDRDGAFDSGDEPYLPGWEFTISGPSGSFSGFTNESGYVLFDNLMIGDYTVTETLKPGGWACTTDIGSPPVRTGVTVSAGATTEVWFGNVIPEPAALGLFGIALLAFRKRRGF